MKKKAFTIPELLVFLTIVGVISVAMITIIKPNEKYLKYAYYNVYNVLATAAYNVIEDVNDARGEESDHPGTVSESDRYFPGIEPGKTDEVYAKELCKKLAINPSSTNKYGYINSTKYNCDSLKTVTTSPTDANFADETNMAFMATNSMRFYITSLDSITVHDPIRNSDTLLKYFVVWVDLNGTRGPNTAGWTEGRAADIVPFVVTTSGQVLPIGNPTVDRRYLSARVQYPTGEKPPVSANRTYYESQIAAYGPGTTAEEYPVNDLHSIRNSWNNKFTSGPIKLEKIPSTTTALDTQCVKGTDDLITKCALMIETEKK
jgi:hypothetical protein